jgi:hypothetical protein
MTFFLRYSAAFEAPDPTKYVGLSRTIIVSSVFSLSIKADCANRKYGLDITINLLQLSV